MDNTLTIVIAIIAVMAAGAAAFEDGTLDYSNIPAVQTGLDFLDSVEAGGGGDHPEAVYAGLRDAIDAMRWSRQARKVVILVGGPGYDDAAEPQPNP